MITHKIVFTIGFILLLFGLSVVSLYGQGLSQSTPKAIIGKITSITGKTLSIKDKLGGSSEVVTNNNTKIFGEDTKTLTLGDIKAGDTVAAIATSAAVLSNPQATGSATASTQKVAEKLYVSQASPSSGKKQVVQGVITGINDSIIAILEQAQPEKYVTVHATESAVVKTKDNQPGDMSSLAVEQRVAVVGAPDTDVFIPLLIQIISDK